MSEVMAGHLLGTAEGSPLPWVRGWLLTLDTVTGENTVQVTGNQTITDVTLLRAPDELVVGPVFLLRTDGGPVVLGNIYKPPLT